MRERGSTSRRNFLRGMAAAGGAGALALGLPSGVAATPEVNGSSIRLQATTDGFENGRRLYDAWNDLVAAGGGALLLPSAEYRIPAPLVCLDHREGQRGGPIALVGEGAPMRGVLIKAGWEHDEEALLDLSGSSHFQLRNIFLDGAYAGRVRTRYGLVLRRTTADSAGRHVLEHCTLVNFHRTGLLSHGSEMLTAVGCNFQRAPIGAVVSAYSIKAIATDADFATHGKDIIKWKDTPISNGGSTFLQCTFGDPQVTSRASLLVAQQSPTRQIGCVYQAAPGAEAKVILDECWGGHFAAPWSDSLGARTIFKVGKYSPNYGDRNNKYQNRFDILDAKVDAGPGDVVLDGSNMVGCTIRNLWVNRSEPPIKLDRTCQWTVVENATNGIAVAGKVPIEDAGQGSLCRWGATGVGLRHGTRGPSTSDFSPGEHGLFRDGSTGRIYFVLNDGGTVKKCELA